MITAVKFHDLVPARIASGQSNSTHGGFGAGIHHAYRLNGSDHIYNGPGHGDFTFSRCAITGAPFGTFDDCLQHFRVGMTENHGTP